MSDYPSAALPLVELEKRRIHTDSLTMQLLPYTTLATLEIDQLRDGLGIKQGEHLIVRIGGITYRTYDEDKYGNFAEVVVHVASDCFRFPFTVKLETGHWPEEPHEHDDLCPYASTEWPIDSAGQRFWPHYDGQTANYDPECCCPAVIDKARLWTINGFKRWQRVCQVVRHSWQNS